MTLFKCYTQYASKFGKLSSAQRTGKCQFSFQSQRRAVPKNVQSTEQLHSLCMLVGYAQNPSSYVNWEFPDVQAGFRKRRGTKDQTVNICWITKKAREFQKNICFIDYAKAFDYVDSNKLWESLKEMEIPDQLTCLLRSLDAGQKSNC